MFSSKLAFCCILALHFNSYGASPLQEMNALQSADLESYPAREWGEARALYITVSNQQGSPIIQSSISGGVLHISITGSSVKTTVTINDRPTHGARFVAPYGRLSLSLTGSSSQFLVNYNGTPFFPAIAFLSINIVGSNTRNNIHISGSSVIPSGSLRISVIGSSSVNLVIINDRLLRPADRRLHISFTGASSDNRVYVNGNPRQIL